MFVISSFDITFRVRFTNSLHQHKLYFVLNLSGFTKDTDSEKFAMKKCGVIFLAYCTCICRCVPFRPGISERRVLKCIMQCDFWVLTYFVPVLLVDHLHLISIVYDPTLICTVPSKLRWSLYKWAGCLCLLIHALSVDNLQNFLILSMLLRDCSLTLICPV